MDQWFPFHTWVARSHYVLDAGVQGKEGDCAQGEMQGVSHPNHLHDSVLLPVNTFSLIEEISLIRIFHRSHKKENPVLWKFLLAIH